MTDANLAEQVKLAHEIVDEIIWDERLLALMRRTRQWLSDCDRIIDQPMLAEIDAVLSNFAHVSTAEYQPVAVPELTNVP